MHEADFMGRYNTSLLDVVESAAVYEALPTEFANDVRGKKRAFREELELSLRKMLLEKQSGSLPAGKLRNSAYRDAPNKGPIRDRTTMHRMHVTRSTGSLLDGFVLSSIFSHVSMIIYILAAHMPRRSFTEVCREHSIFNAVNRKKSIS